VAEMSLSQTRLVRTARMLPSKRPDFRRGFTFQWGAGVGSGLHAAAILPARRLPGSGVRRTPPGCHEAHSPVPPVRPPNPKFPTQGT